MKIRYEGSWRTGPYAEVIVSEGGASMSSGLLDPTKQQNLRISFGR